MVVCGVVVDSCHHLQDWRGAYTTRPWRLNKSNVVQGCAVTKQDIDTQQHLPFQLSVCFWHGLPAGAGELHAAPILNTTR